MRMPAFVHRLVERLSLRRAPTDPAEHEAELDREAAETQSRLAAGGLDAHIRPGRSI